MTTKRLAVALVVVALALQGAVTTVAGAQNATVRDAQLVVDQPHYVEGGVETQDANGSVVYVASGEVLELTPQNFAAADVTSFGASGNASLSLDSRTGEYKLTAPTTGTYEVFWTVERPSANGSDNSTVRERYVARVRVDGGVGLTHQRDEALAETRAAAENWQEFNSTLQQRDLVGAAGIETTLEEMIRWYELRKNPQEALTGGLVAFLVISFTTVGALLVWLFVFGGYQWIVRKLRERLHIFEAVESEEGTAKQALAELDRQAKLEEPMNWDWQDLDGFDDHIAGAMRDVFGPTVGGGVAEFLSANSPRTLVADRLQAMGEAGYLGRQTDDGTEFVHRDEVDVEAYCQQDGAVDLRAADREAIADFRDGMDSWDHPTIRAFDLPEADYDARELNTTFESADLEQIIEQTQADMRHFDSPQAYGEYLREFLTAVEDSPLTDEHGRPDEVRYAMSHFLRLAQLLDDRFELPAIPFHREAIERALVDFDPEQEARDVIDEARMAGGGD